MKNNNIFSFLIRAIFSMLLLLTACTTTKNTPLHRGWHNMNARYNGYFYAGEMLKESIQKVEDENKDDFTKLLPVFIYPTNETAKSYYEDFDKVIKKSSTVIERHAITTKNKVEIANACRWIDENYMLVGKADFYKRDFMAALEVFTYVAQEYPNPLAKYQGMLWMIHTNNEFGSLSLSEPIIDEIRNADDFPKKKKYRAYKRDFEAVTTDYYIKRIDYGPAIEHLLKTIAITKKKTLKARYYYILAQLYQKQGDNKNASEYFGKVNKYHPAYDMAFNAKINQAKMYDTENGDSKYIKKQLTKMLKDSKNIEFQDQIYYALAQIAYKEKDVPLALKYLDKSIQNSTNNPTQKALSFLKRADIYFEKPNYPLAEANYDSAMTFLPTDYPDYAAIQTKKNSLNALVINLNVIKMQDSLLALSKMSDKERGKAIDKLIANKEEEERRKEEERQRLLVYQQQQASNPTKSPIAPIGGSTAWYFYNPTTVSFGVTEFAKKWGDRKLEDNWRRSEKEQGSVVDAVDDQGNPIDTALAANNTGVAASSLNAGSGSIKDKSSYLNDIPSTPEAITSANNKIIDAFYNVGTIYKEELSDKPKSAEALEELLKRYPDNKYKLSTYYQLYRTYLSMNNMVRAEYYKNIILNDHPDTEYARIIRNPEYGKNAMANKSQIDKFYAETYELYMNGKYLETIDRCTTADTLYTKNHLMPQFDYLKALSIGRTQDVNAFEKALTQVVIKHPKAPVTDKAQATLELIKKQKPVLAPIIADSTTKSNDTIKKDSITKHPYIFKEEGKYFWTIAIEKGKGDFEKFKARLTDSITKNLGILKLEVAGEELDAKHQLIKIQTFENKLRAMDFYNLFKSDSNLFENLVAGTHYSFIISAENYELLKNNKNLDEYLLFFSQNFK